MEKGPSNLQSIARAARKASAPSEEPSVRDGKEEHEGDSGIGCSDAELEPANTSAIVHRTTGPASFQTMPPATGLTANQQNALFHILPRLPPLPLYQPPPSAPVRTTAGAEKVQMSGHSASSPPEQERTSDKSTQRSVSIKSMLSHAPRP